MKHVMSILKSCVGFLLLAVLIGVTVSYFNRGKDAAVKNMDNVLGIVEGMSADGLNLASYDGKDIKGSEAISIIESLPASGAGVPVLVYTNGKATVAEYTKAGATDGTAIDLTKGAYVSGSPAPASASKATGNYRIKADATYINPSLTYSVKCHYTSNQSLAFVTITQK